MIYIGFDSLKQQKDFIYNENLRTHKEKWHKIKINGESTKYSISNFGRLKNRHAGKIDDFSDRKIKNKDTTGSYIEITMVHHKHEYHFMVHRLVAVYFCKIPARHIKSGKTYSNLVVNHKDGVKYHNAAFNLEWVTTKENAYHAFNEKLCVNIFGEKSHLAKIKEKDVIKICKLIMEKKNNKEISSIMSEIHGVDVSIKIIQHIRAGECWKEVTKNYTFPKLSNSIPNTIPDSVVHEICKLLETNKYKNVEIAKMMNVKREFVKDIKTHRRRKDISQQYNF